MRTSLVITGVFLAGFLCGVVFFGLFCLALTDPLTKSSSVKDVRGATVTCTRSYAI